MAVGVSKMVCTKMWLIGLCFIVFSSMALPLHAAQPIRGIYIHAAPDGSDKWSGRLARPNKDRTDGPVASLEGARRAVYNRLHSKDIIAGAVVVEFANGTYPMSGPVVFTPDDSGTETTPILYKSAQGAHPVFSGGRRVTGWRTGANGIWTAKIPAVAAGDWYFEQLWINGRRAVRARTPNEFYSYMVGKANYGIDPDTGKPGNLGSRAFRARPEDIQPLLGLSPKELNDATVVVLHSWEASRLRVARVDAATSTVVTTGPAAWNFMEWGPTQRYYIENVKSALDTPGEWFLSRDGTVFYKPLPGESMSSAEVVAPVAEQFIRLEGTADKRVSNLTFQGLAFRYGQHILEPKGHSDGQAAFTVPAVVMADYAHDITFDKCEIGHIGLYGVWFRKGCTNCRVAHTYIHDMGAGAIRIGQGWDNDNPNATDTTGHVTLDDNILQSGGHIFPGCVGVWIGHSGDNVVTHNDIGDYRYTAVSVGWRWGYADSQAKRNTISYNHIHNIGWGVLSDMGGVYTLGPSDGTVVSNNIIHDVYSYDKYGRGGWGLYNDEGTTHMVLENNLVYNTKTGGYHQHYGRENLIRNNIFAFSMDGQLQRSRVEEWVPFTFQRNIVYWTSGPLFSGTWTDANMRLDHNLYWQSNGVPISFAGSSLEKWQAAGRDIGSIVADPGFKDAQAHNFLLSADSPALKIGFVPFDLSKPGVYGDPDWKALARRAVYPPVRFAPEPPPAPPLTLNQDFESLPVGAPCPDAQNSVEGRGDAIAVTDETAFSGKQSLKITDAPGLINGFDPYLAFMPARTRGLSIFHFAMRVEPGVVMYHEWRDWRTEAYKLGPSFWVTGGKLTIAGKAVADIAASNWVEYTVRAGVGEDSDGTWSLTIKPQGGDETVFRGLKCEGGKLGALTWAGFSSMATEKTVFYLDDLRLTNSVPSRQ